MPEPIQEQQKQIYDRYAKEEEINSLEAIYLINEAINEFYDEEIFENNPKILFSKNSLKIENISVPKDKQEFFEIEVLKLISVLNEG